MRTHTHLHDVTAVEFDSIKCLKMTDGREFYSRSLVVSMSDGTSETINLFSDNGYNLLASDGELDSLKKAA